MSKKQTFNLGQLISPDYWHVFLTSLGEPLCQ
jgi:hypothetical protein